ncbi:hypothetical protein V3W47_17350 [Deinococcus sp. YIM 134068]|uniref:hypothetical protein n=1 Tax=Deinococcus lichenicola TaxID=3118910 RepID=UPI002F940995
MTGPKEQEDVQLSESARSPSPQDEQAQTDQAAPTDEQAGNDGKHGRPSDDADPGHS